MSELFQHSSEKLGPHSRNIMGKSWEDFLS